MSKEIQIHFTDDVISDQNPGTKLFRVVVLLGKLEEMSVHHAVRDVQAVEDISQDLALDGTTFFIPKESLPDFTVNKTILDALVTDCSAVQLLRSLGSRNFAKLGTFHEGITSF